MKIATWNVNGIRARFEDVTAWSDAEQPDVFCLQELKAAPSQVPEPLTGLPRYHNHWHGGAGGYSGVSLHLRRDTVGAGSIDIPDFDEEHRIATARLASGLVVASVYVHNGGKGGLEPKLRFLGALKTWVADRHAAGEQVLVCGDLNVTRSDADLHPSHHKQGGLGQSKKERAALEALLSEGVVDALRQFTDDDSLFTWFPPWRDEKAKNHGWRIDYVLASESLAPRLSGYAIQKDVGTSDHVPFVVELAD